MAMKKGIFFTIDSIIASSILLLVILLTANFYTTEHQSTNINYASQDLVRVFSTLKVMELDNDYVESLLNNGTITNGDNTILEQIGDFWANDQINLSINFTRNISEAIIPSKYGFSVIVDDEVIYSRPIPIKKALVSSKKIISGIAKAKPIEGYTSRVLLNGIQSKTTNSYLYFGGYEGDGNLTKKLILPKDIISFNSSYIEVDTGGNFRLYINGNYAGNYTQGTGGGGSGGNLSADKWNVNNSYLGFFMPGENIIALNFTNGSSYIGGGFLRVRYTTSSYNGTLTPGMEKMHLPGVDGTINIYSSMYVPGELTAMSIFLNYSSNYSVYLKLGNTTVYQAAGNGSKNVTLDNATLNGLIDYDIFRFETVPLRLAIGNASTIGGNAYAVMVSDMSGSMEFCAKVNTETWGGWRTSATKGCVFSGGQWWWGWFNYTPNNGYVDYNRTFWSNGSANLCGCRYRGLCKNDTKKIDLYRNASALFINTIFNVTGNRIGIIDFSSSNDYPVYNGTCNTANPTTSVFPDSIVRKINITSNKTKLLETTNSSSTYWGTCICCGINSGVDMIRSQNNNKAKKFLIVMSDGTPTSQCAQQPNGTAVSDAVQSAWDACALNFTVYSIGFGNDVDSITMSRLNCSGGKFFNATNATKLQDTYSQIAGEINQLSFSEQTINTSGSLIRSIIYPSSYIEFNYSSQPIVFNQLPMVFETDRFGNNASGGFMTVYPNASVYDAKVTSYSGSKWTDNLVVNGDIVYRLGDYGVDYKTLGDPFAVDVPVTNLIPGNNSLVISTGINLTASTGGSPDNRAIYTLLLSGITDYSAVVAKSSGCVWNVTFEDGGSSLIKVPLAYSGSKLCYYFNSSYDPDDSLDINVYQLFGNLDIDKDQKLDVNINENNLNVNSVTISKVPSLWGPAIIEIRIWE